MTTTAALLIGAMLAQGAIALVLLWILGVIRVPMVASGKMPIKAIALSRDPWPEHEKRVSNAFDNQFQLPLLFYVACGLCLYLGPIWVEVLLAWLFVLSRVAHASIFAIRNQVHARFFAYTTGYFILVILWVDLIVRLLLIAGAH